MTAGSDRVGVMVMRVWLEGDDSVVRARMTQTPDLQSQQPTTDVAVGADQVTDAVRAWIDGVVAGGAGDAGGR